MINPLNGSPIKNIMRRATPNERTIPTMECVSFALYDSPKSPEKILNKANVVDGNNNYDTNETTNPTSTKPVKDVFSPSDDKVSIDGNEVKAGQELLYKVTYKNTTGKDQKVVCSGILSFITTFWSFPLVFLYVTL